MARPIVSGVYALCNAVTGAAYIGCTSDIAHRWVQHRSQLRAGRHVNRALQLAWQEDGASVFTLVIIERGRPRDYALQLAPREGYWRARARAAGVVLYNDQVGRGRRVAA